MDRREFLCGVACAGIAGLAACAKLQKNEERPATSEAKKETDMIACCGIDCGACDILRAGSDPVLAEKVAQRFVAGGDKDMKAEYIRCGGCRSGECWSGDCKILKCCVERGHRNCSQCPEFACEHVTAFENDGWAHHAAGVKRLRSMAENAKR